MVDRYFQMMEAQVLAGNLVDEDNDPLVSGATLFVRSSGRADLADRFSDLAEKAGDQRAEIASRAVRARN